MHPNAASKLAPIVAPFPAAAIVLWALGFAWLAAASAAAQIRPPTPTRIYDPQPSAGTDVPGPEGPPSMESVEYEKRLRVLNADRQKSLVSDTARLLKLANELNDQLAALTGDPTPGQLRKIAEIEKLARSVKSKMSNSVRTLPPFTGLGPPVR